MCMNQTILKKYPRDKILKRLLLFKEKYEKKKKYMENIKEQELELIVGKGKVRHVNKNEYLSKLKLKLKRLEIKIAIRVCETENLKQIFYDLHK